MNLHAFYLAPAKNGEDLRLWEGYIPSESNFHYARFAGIHQSGEPIWIFEHSEIPENAQIIPIATANAIIEKFKQRRLTLASSGHAPAALR